MRQHFRDFFFSNSNSLLITFSWALECFPTDQPDGDPATAPLPTAYQRWLDDRLGADYRAEGGQQGRSRVVVGQI
jgi:hypothetical protein